MNTPLNYEGSFEENKLTQQLKTERSMQSRLILWLQLYPFSISGLRLENLINDQKKKFRALLEPAIKKTLSNLKNVPTPKEIKIDRNILNKISEHTGVSRRSLERGISSFFARKKNDNTVQETKHTVVREGGDQEIQKEKENKKELTNENENEQKNKSKNENKNRNRNRNEKKQIKQTNSQQVEETLIMNLVRQKRSLHAFNQLNSQSINNTKHNHNLTNFNINQNNKSRMNNQSVQIPDQQTLKTPLQILCEVSQLYKKRRLNTPQYGLLKKTNFYSKKN